PAGPALMSFTDCASPQSGVGWRAGGGCVAEPPSHHHAHAAPAPTEPPSGASHDHAHDHGPAHTHAHAHGHRHAPSSYNRAFAIGVALNLAIVAAQAPFGVLANSPALVA